jgi:hypothetical protein
MRCEARRYGDEVPAESRSKTDVGAAVASFRCLLDDARDLRGVHAVLGDAAISCNLAASVPRFSAKDKTSILRESPGVVRRRVGVEPG